ncbi:MAG: PAS domain S-box protein [Pyrinomonadaceae bacterium]
MHQVATNPDAFLSVEGRAKDLFSEHRQSIYERTDRMFAVLMVVQWVAGIVAALLISPRTWIGSESQTHIHIWASIFLGGAINLFPVALALTRPGKPSTRYCIAIGQMLMGALLIHLSGGRIETHFHVFGSLAFLAFYRDWRVLLPATLVVVVDHFVRGVFFPQSVYGVLTASTWRVVEHAGWVVFIDIFLVISCLRATREMQAIAGRTAALEISEERFRNLVETLPFVVYEVEPQPPYTPIYISSKIESFGYPLADWFNQPDLWTRIIHPGDREWVLQATEERMLQTRENEYEYRITCGDGKTRWIYDKGRFIFDKENNPIRWQGIMLDITERKRTEDELGQSQKWLAAMFEASQDGILVEESEHIVFVNQRFLQMYGYTDSREVIGKHPSHFLTPEDNARMMEYGRKRARGETVPTVYEFNGVSIDGTTIELEASISTFTSNGKLYIVTAQKDITERKQAEEILRNSEEQHRLLFESNPQPAYVYDIETFEFLAVNEAAVRHYGYSREEFLTVVTMKDIRPVEDIPFFLERVSKISPHRNIILAPSRHQKKDGTVINVEITSQVLEFDGRSAEIVLVNDVTERKRAETERQVSAEIIQSVVTTTNLDELFKVAHQSISKLLYAENFFIALHNPTTDLIHFEYWVDEVDPVPSPSPIGKGFTSYVLHTGQPFLITEEIRDRMYERGEVEHSGTNCASWLGVPLRTPSRTIGVLAVQYYEKENAYNQRDLELLASVGDQLALAIERKQTEIELQTREAQLIEAQQIAHLGNWEWDIAANKVTWSDEEYRIFGLEPQEFVATYEAYLNCVHPDDRESVADIIGKAMQDKKYPDFDHRIIRPDGEVRVIHASGKITLDESGNPTKMLGTIQDITERKRIEEELEKTRDAALESTRLKSEFLANMSHEIRTPMNGVMGMTGLLLDSDLTDEQRDFTETIRSSSESLLTVINDILDFSKIEAGKLHFERLDFDVRGGIESTVELLAERAQAKNIELASLVDRNVPTQVRGDAGRLRQVLVNLVSNAVKFTEAGEVTVCAKKESETDTHVTIRYAVSDTGIGISPEAQQRLFQAFVQADGSTTRKYGGTGLGLAISKQLVELMGGEIGVESEIGRGSTFWFTARLEKPSDEIQAATPQPLDDLHGLRVLVVDDNAMNRQILIHQTTSWGMIAVEAGSGVEALESLRAASAKGEPFDVALLDFQMPGMDGFELTRLIKTDAEIASVRLVLMPSFGNRGDGQLARKMGIAAYLMKPVRQSQLFDCLTTVMAETGADAPKTPQASRLVTRHSLKETMNTSRTRILIAEDNLVNQKVAIRQVAKLGYTADIVGNGQEALEALTAIPYHIVLMDCQMPLMDGFEATREIRRREGESKHTVIIAMTANALEGDRDKCLAAGMDDYLSKPVKVEELQQTLERWQNSFAIDATTDSVEHNSTMEHNSPPVDMERLLDVANGDEELLRELIELSLQQVSDDVVKLRTAIEAEAADDVNRLAHTNVGGCATCGMDALSALMRKLEEMGQANQLAGAAAVVAEVEREFERTKTFLRDSLKLEVNA